MYLYNPRCPMGTSPYAIRPGDTLYSIAMRYNTTIAAILRANPRVNPHCIRVGQVICIPMAPVPVPPTTPRPCPTGTLPYTVQPGDTFYSIARRYNITVADLMAVNPGVDPDNLMVGQRLCIPEAPPATCPMGTFSYVIRAGDTIYSLALRYNTTVSAILNANPGLDPEALRVGQRICIPERTAPPGGCPAGTFPHTIQPGDTFYNLARRYNTTIEAIQAANPNADPNNLIIGEQLCIPGTPPGDTCPTGTFAYTIRSGDTFYSLAIRYNTTVAAIQAANPGVDPDNLQIGQRICIPEGTTPPGGCPNGTFAYTIRSGDTFYSLAQRYNTTVAAIQAANPGVDPDNLQIGQRICIPSAPPPGTCPNGTFAYTIRSGDTFYSLAQRYNTTVAAIQAANPNADPNNLIIGEQLCIPRS